jgi:hypothetical protein
MRWRQDVVDGGASVDLVVVCGGGARVDRGSGVCRERQGQTRGVFSVKPRFFRRPPLKPMEINFFVGRLRPMNFLLFYWFLKKSKII